MFLYYTSSFLKGFFVAKKLDVELEEMFGLFMEGFLSSCLKGQLIFSSNLFTILEWCELTCFFNVVMPLVVLYMTNPFLGWGFGITNIGLLWQRIQCIIWGIVTLTSLLSLTQ